MLKYQDIPPNKKAIIFELDDVLIPQKDYDLQVYYLFANFIEYLETFPPAQEMLNFITKRYETHGQKEMFEETANVFGLDLKYRENLNILFENAKLPLKLLLYKEVLELLQELTINRKQIYILTSGNPKRQLNKITQTEWHGLDKYLKVYFADEFEAKPSSASINYLIEENGLIKNDILLVSNHVIDEQMATMLKIDYQKII
ncbi:HAD hydrolase-like protein [Pedobacter sp. SD-b]|uniref:HAD hydrolase-like protein n=1 Tax=Pedobacter segetis TaxID=2793069 RepID=A0ABS1BHK6_9SPHI|nr:HAD hydrolase-like protein [Pedobacter segetis]MBK0382369.1 HAD hydrolase-like protein [Pedobacter segetis]